MPVDLTSQNQIRDPLLATRFFTPPLPAACIPRPHLTQHLALRSFESNNRIYRVTDSFAHKKSLTQPKDCKDLQKSGQDWRKSWHTKMSG
jgi:hypothetical protein